jgi:hypothetical protein
MEEKVAHNSPLLRRVTDPFSNRPVVDNFQEYHADSRRLGTVSPTDLAEEAEKQTRAKVFSNMPETLARRRNVPLDCYGVFFFKPSSRVRW